MSQTDIKAEFLDNIYTDTKYFLINKKKELYKIILVTKSKKNKKQESYTLTLIPGVSFQISPLAFEQINPITLVKAASKVALYDQLDKIIDISLSSGFTDIHEEANGYYDGEGKYISDLVANVPFVDYDVNDAEAIYTIETSKNNFIRYDVYKTAIKVSKDKIKNNTFYYESIYTLWYPSLNETKKAIQPILEDKNTNTYTFESFRNKAREIDDHEEIRLDQEEVLFEHLIKTESYLSDDISNLQIPIPQSKFVNFDESNIEEGRIYFWIKKNEKSILKSNINFFVLQNRKINGYIAMPCKLGGFRSMYMHDNIMTFSMSDEIQHLKDRVSKGFVEISQEEVIEILTCKTIGEIFAQTVENSVYLENHVYDLYNNMIQHWGGGSDKEDFTNHTLFFDSKEKRDDWFLQELATQKNYGLKVINKEQSFELLSHYKSLQELNIKYLEQKIIKDNLLKDHPDLKEKLSSVNYAAFMKYAPLKIIEGDYEFNDSLLLNADETSLFIKGDLIVNGTLMTETALSLRNDNFLIITGNLIANNYVQNPAYKFMLIAKDFLVKEVTYLPAASRSWFIDISEKLHTDIFIHAKEGNVKGEDEKIKFTHEYSTTNKNVFIDGFFDKKNRTDQHFLFNSLKLGKNLLLDDLNQDEIDNELLLTSFKRHLRNWHQLYYEFGGFELQQLECGEHYGCYIESDEIVKDIRHDTGMYLMNHDDFSLELVQAKKPINKDHVSSKDLAYRFFWIMWTFSNWKHRADGPMDYWKDIEAIDTRYNNGKAYFKDDPHLALYWIMHFGLLEDARYDEIKELMIESDHSLIQGAFLFFTELKQVKTFPIEIDYKKNTSLFNNRIIHHKEQLKEAMVPEGDKVAYTMSQFEKQPERILEFIDELYKGKEWDKISEYLKNNSYQTGFSFLQVQTTKEGDESKWQKLFIEETEIHKDTWEKPYILIDIFETFYKDLDYESTNTILSIVMSFMMTLSSTTRWGKAHVKILEHFKTLPQPQNLSQVYEARLKGFTKENFDFQTFLNKSADIKLEDKMDFIRVCINTDLFNTEVSNLTISPYLLIWFLADKDFYPVKEDKRTQEVEEVIKYYSLNKIDFKDRHKDISQRETSELFKQIKKYF